MLFSSIKGKLHSSSKVQYLGKTRSYKGPAKDLADCFTYTLKGRVISQDRLHIHVDINSNEVIDILLVGNGTKELLFENFNTACNGALIYLLDILVVISIK